jgi:ribose-phosphate pyrophosphokinase
MVFSGSSHEGLAREIASELRTPLGKVHRETFPDGEIGIQIQENVRGKDIFIVQSGAKRPNHYLMELLIMVDAFKRASARSISSVMPYYAYARQDRKDKPRVPITAKLVANLLEKAGITRVLTMDLHTEQIQGFFDIPVDHLYARPLFIKMFDKLRKKDLIIVSPDVGSNKLARKFAEDLNVDLAIVDKRRIEGNRVEANAVIGDVRGKNVILVDDICSTGGTLKSAALACRKEGAKGVCAAVTHGLFATGGGSKDATAAMLKESGIEEIFVTDTIPQDASTLGSFGLEIRTVPTAALFAQAIDCVVNAKSISSLFRND